MVAAPKPTDGADWSMFASVPEEAVVRNPSLLLYLPAANIAFESKKGSEEQKENKSRRYRSTYVCDSEILQDKF